SRFPTARSATEPQNKSASPANSKAAVSQEIQKPRRVPAEGGNTSPVFLCASGRYQPACFDAPAGQPRKGRPAGSASFCENLPPNSEQNLPRCDFGRDGVRCGRK